MAIAAACSFPEPTLVPDEAGAPGNDGAPTKTGIAPDGGGDARLDSAFAIDGNENVDPDGASQEASTRPDGATVLEAGACKKTCDCDEDGVYVKDASCAMSGNDCNDLDPFVPYTGGFVADKPPPGFDGDWNCDGTVTKQFNVNIQCGLLTDCSAKGFTGDPGCGSTGEYVECSQLVLPLGIVCQNGKTENRVQGCR